MDTFNGRIKMSIKIAGWDSTQSAAVALHRRYKLAYPGAPVTPQTVHLWLNYPTAKISVDCLYRLADLFSVNARWLAYGTQPMHRERDLSHDEDSLIATHRAASEAGKDSIIKQANFVLQAEQWAAAKARKASQ